MPAKPRSKVFDPDRVGVYHCWNRLVRRRHLFGWDAFTGKDFGYRKDWVRDRFRQLAGSMAIDILDYAILVNHLHFVLRNRPDIVSTWSDEEVVRRWWHVCPPCKNDDGSISAPKPCELNLLLPNVAEYRRRLSDISWMMRLGCQTIARRAKREDDVDGRFFAKRFDCKQLKTWTDVLACSIYVDLNWIHAGLADTPEQSQFTSAFDRIRARWHNVSDEIGNSISPPVANDEADAWLAPVALDERGIAFEHSATMSSNKDAAKCTPDYNRHWRGTDFQQRVPAHHARPVSLTARHFGTRRPRGQAWIHSGRLTANPGATQHRAIRLARLLSGFLPRRPVFASPSCRDRVRLTLRHVERLVARP